MTDCDSDDIDRETVTEWATRMARDETGYGEPESEDWIRHKAILIETVAKAFCHYHNGGSSINSCCARDYRCRAAALAGAIIRFGDGKASP